MEGKRRQKMIALGCLLHNLANVKVHIGPFISISGSFPLSTRQPQSHFRYGLSPHYSAEALHDFSL